MPAALTLSNLTKTYGSARGVSNLNLEVQSGEVFGFLGPNGAGKSTTINMLLDFIRPTSGKATILGLDSRNQAVAVHRQVGYLSGDMETEPNLTGKQYLEYVANLRGNVKSAVLKAYSERLGAETNKKIKHLSRGNKQKIGLVAALMHEPEMLILDEPTSGLDPLSQATFHQIIKEYADQGKTVFVSSHILSEIQNICDRVGFIRAGKLVDVQPLTTLMKRAIKKVHCTFTKKADMPQKLPAGAENPRRLEAVLTFDYKGQADVLVTWLGQQKLSDLYIQEADLEELFMHYYRGDKVNV